MTSRMTSRRPDDIFTGSLPGECFVPVAPDFGSAVKKAPENPISVVDGKPGGARERPMTDPSVSVARRAQPGVPLPGRPAGAGTTVARTVAVRATVPPSRYPPVGRPSCGAVPFWPGGCRPASTRGSGRGVKPAPGPGRADLTGRAEWRVDACGPGWQASAPRRPAPGPAASTPGNGEGAHEVTARDHPAPAPAGLPLRQGRAALQPRHAARPRGLTSFPRSQGRPPRPAPCRRRPGGGRT